MQEFINQLQCVILPAKHVPPAAVYYYEAIYRFWHENWLYTLKNESKEKWPDILYSDDFRRQDTIVSLFYQGTPIGLHITDHMNLNYLAAREHSSLVHYPESLLEQLITEDKSKIITWGNFVIAKSWRKHQNNFNVADVFPGIGKKLLLKSAASCVTCITRDDRKVNVLLSRHGFQAHAQLYLHGREASIMILTRAAVKDVGDDEIDGIINRLWKNRLDFSCEAGVTERNTTSSEELVV